MPGTNSTNSILKGTSIVSSLTILSRGLGFIRDLLLARLFGAGLIADAFFVAFRIPNILRSFVAEGALTSAFVPVFTDQLKQGHQQARETIRSVTALLLLLTTALTLLGIAFAPEIIDLFAPGFINQAGKSELSSKLLQIMMPFIICVSIVAMLNGALNSVKIFGAAAFAQVAMNLALIAGALYASYLIEEQRAIAIALWVLIGGIMQIFVQLPALKRADFTLIPALTIITPATLRILKLLLPAILGAAIYQLTMFLNTVLASLLAPGSVAWLFYADRLVQLPIGVFSVALASVLLPALSNAASQNDQKLFVKSYIDALRYTTFIVLPLSVFMFSYADELVSLFFERGAFSALDSVKTAAALKAGAIGIWGVSCHSMTVRAFFARQDTRTPTIIGAVTLFIAFIAALLLMGKISFAHKAMLPQLVVSIQTTIASFLPLFEFSHAGLALASSIATTLSFCMAAFWLNQRERGLSWLPFLKSGYKCLISALIIWLLSLFLRSWDLGVLYCLILAVPLSASGYIFSTYLLKTSELQETFSTFARVLDYKR